MANFQLSQSEREYIVNGVREDLRADGRTCTDYRHFTVRTGVVSNTSGSAKIELVSPWWAWQRPCEWAWLSYDPSIQEGGCAVIGVKAELGPPDATSPEAGKIEFFVDW